MGSRRELSRRVARTFIWPDLKNVRGRIAGYERLPDGIRQQVHAELVARIETAQQGHTAAAAAASVAAIGASLTLVATFSLALFSGWLSAAVARQDPSTGLVPGMSQSQANDMSHDVVDNILVAAGTAVLIALLALWVAHLTDRRRGVLVACLAAYEDADRRLDVSRAAGESAPHRGNRVGARARARIRPSRTRR